MPHCGFNDLGVYMDIKPDSTALPDDREAGACDPAEAEKTGIVVEYRLDAQDRIVGVNEDWRRFASANGVETLMPEKVVGRPLRSFISGDITRMFVDTLLQGVRLTGRERKLPYRCDSPDAKRYMEMTIGPAPAGGIVTWHRVIREERFGSPNAFVVGTGRGQRRDLVKRCSMCNRLSRNGGDLVDPEVARREGWLLGGAATPVIYFVCKTCQEFVKEQRAGR
jgi:hypothetical protein